MKGSEDNEVFRRLYRARAPRRTDSMCQSTRAWNMWSVILPLEPKHMVTPVHGRLVPSSLHGEDGACQFDNSHCTTICNCKAEIPFAVSYRGAMRITQFHHDMKFLLQCPSGPFWGHGGCFTFLHIVVEMAPKPAWSHFGCC